MSTFERLPLHMCPLMSPTTGAVRERFAAVVARVRFYPAVYPGVPVDVVMLTESFNVMVTVTTSCKLLW